MNRNKERFLLSAIFLFCFAIRVAYIDQKNLWFDEVFSWHITLGSFYDIVVATTNDIHPPLFYFILKIWNFFFGDSVFVMRLLSAICTSFAVFYIYGISKRFLSSAYAFIPLLLYCISPLNLFYSQEVRMSGMNLLFNIAAVYYFIRILEFQLDKKNVFRQQVFYLFIFFQAAALYTHYFSFFILIAQIIFLIIHFKKEIKSCKVFVIAYSIVAAIYIIWMPALIEHIKRGQVWRQKQDLSGAANEIVYFIKNVSMGLYYFYHSDYNLIQYLTWITEGLAIILILLAFIKSAKRTQINVSLLIGLMLIVPILLATIISFNQKIEFYRYLSILVPYICIYIVYLLSKIKYKSIVIFLIIIFSSVNVSGMYFYYAFNFKNNDYRQIISDINLNFKDGELIYVYPHYCGWIIDYTKKQENLKIPNFVNHRYGWNVLLDTLRSQNPSRFWLVMDYSDVDTTQFNGYINSVKSTYTNTYFKNYDIAPAKVEVYEFKR